MDVSKFRTNKTAEVSGVWVNIGEGAKLLLARANNPEFTKLMRKLSKPYATQVRTGTMPDERAEEILCEAMAKTVLLGWEGMTDGEVRLPYSEETAHELLLNTPDFRAVVLELASEREHFQKEEIEAAKGN